MRTIPQTSSNISSPKDYVGELLQATQVQAKSCDVYQKRQISARLSYLHSWRRSICSACLEFWKAYDIRVQGQRRQNSTRQP